MNPAQIYILIAIIVLAIIFLIRYFLFKKREVKRLSPLAGLAFGFVLAGIFFGSNRFLGYGLIGVGVILAIIDMLREMKVK
jgi:xanthine/uracil permease